MSFITFGEWRSMGITQEIMNEFKRRQDFAKAYLAENAGKDPLQDRWYTGAIAAYQDFLDINQEDINGN